MFQIAEGNFNTPAPVITGFDVFQNKSMRQISNHIFICILCDLDFYNPKLHEIRCWALTMKKTQRTDIQKQKGKSGCDAGRKRTVREYGLDQDQSNP